MDAPRKRIIVCGGRNYGNRAVIRTALEALWRKHGPFTMVHGDCKGADRMATAVALELNDRFCQQSGGDDYAITIEEHPADWTSHGEKAGPIRNRRMASLGADGCVAFPGQRGTASMVDIAKNHGIPVWDLRNLHKEGKRDGWCGGGGLRHNKGAPRPDGRL